MTTLEATGGQTSIDYDLLDKASQEAIFEIYQQLQDGGDDTLLEKYEDVVAKVLRDMHAFNKQKGELEQTLRSEKQKYTSYLENLENDVEMQIKDVETNVKNELDAKHQRELQLLRNQMEKRMTELQENFLKFNEESTRMNNTATNNPPRGRRVSVAPNELITMRKQVSELADQSATLRSELALAQSALGEYRQQVSDLLTAQEKQAAQMQFISEKPIILDNRHSGHEDNSYSSRRSSRYSINLYNNSTGDGGEAPRIQHGVQSAFSPSGGDSGLDGTWHGANTTISTATIPGGDNGFSPLPERPSNLVTKGEEPFFDSSLYEGHRKLLSGNNNNNPDNRMLPTGEEKEAITPPEFSDPNNLPEHVQFKIERFQQSMLAEDAGAESGSSEQPPLVGEDNRNDKNSHRHRRRLQHQRLPNASRTSFDGSNIDSLRNADDFPDGHNATSPHLFQKTGTSTVSRASSSRYNNIAGDLLSHSQTIPRSRGLVAVGSNPTLSGRASGSLTSLLAINNSGDQENGSNLPKSGSSAGGRADNVNYRQDSHVTESNTVFSNSTGFGAVPGELGHISKSHSQTAMQMQPNNQSVQNEHQMIFSSTTIDAVSTVALEPERVYRVILAGDSAVGKSSILMRLVEDRFVGHLPTTLGVDFFTRLFQIDDDEHRTVALQLWDTAGQERFRSLARSYFRRADGVLLVYDVTSEKTFLSVRDWISIVRDSSDADVSILICANKSDLRQFCSSKSMKTVSTADGEQLAEAYNTLFVETSAKTGEGVVDGITELIRIMRSREDLTMRTVGLHLDEHSDPRLHTFRCNPIGASASVKRPTCS